MRALIGSLLVAAAVSGPCAALADPTITFTTTDQPIGLGLGLGNFTSQAGDDIYMAGAFGGANNVYVGETIVGSGYINGYRAAPSAYAKAFAEGTYSGEARSIVSWEVEGTLGPIPTVASGIPVLLTGLASLSYDSATGPYAGQAITSDTGTFARSSASVILSGVTQNQNFYCGGVDINITSQSCGDNAINDDFRLLPTLTPGIYQGFVTIIADTTVVDDLGLGTTNSYTNFDRKSATALVDPEVSIAGAFYALYPNATLTFNPIVGNDGNPLGLPIPSPAPEPAVWAMMILGVALTGARIRRRSALACLTD